MNGEVAMAAVQMKCLLVAASLIMGCSDNQNRIELIEGRLAVLQLVVRTGEAIAAQ